MAPEEDAEGRVDPVDSSAARDRRRVDRKVQASRSRRRLLQPLLRCRDVRRTAVRVFGFAVALPVFSILAIAAVSTSGAAEEQRLQPTADAGTSAVSSIQSRSPENPGALADQVRAIFAAKCVECHDEATARPRGEFGYVLDLARVAENPEMIIPGEPEKSELYLMVEDDEMPGDEASVPPLTPEEKETVKRWIAAGAPSDVHPPSIAAAAGETPEINAVKPVSPSARRFTLGQRIIRALGQFHPPSSHYPIALLTAAFPAEFMWKRTRKRSWKATVRFCVMLGALSAVVTAALGWCDAAFSNYGGASASILAWHRWLGTGTAVWAVLTAVLSEIAHKEGNPRRLRYLFRAVLFIGIVLVSVAGYLGASLVYGLHHFTW